MRIIDQVLLYESDTRVQPVPELENVREFKQLWSRDRGSQGDSQGRKKLRARLEFAYIFHMCSYKSPYAKVPEYDRHDVICADLMPDDWVRDEMVDIAMEKYIALTTSPSLSLVIAGQEAINSLAEFLRRANFDPGKIIEVNGEMEFAPVVKVTDVVSALSKIGDLTESMKQLRVQLAKDQEEANTVRKGVEKTKYNDPGHMMSD